MKKLMNLLISTILILSVPPVRADESAPTLDDAVASAETLRNSLQDGYLPYVRSVIGNQIKTQYLFRFWDHAGSREILKERADKGLHRLNEISQEFDRLRTGFSLAKGNWEENAVRAMALVAQVQTLTTKSRQIVRDGEALKASWSGQCRQDLRDRMRSYNDPLALLDIFEPGAVSGIAPNPEFHVQFEITTDFDGGNTSVSPGEGPNGTDGAIDTVGYALIQTGNPYAVIVGAIIIAGDFIYRIGAMGHALAKAARKKGHLYDLLNQIRDIQFNVLKTVSAEVPGYIAKDCAEAFPEAEADNMYLALFTDYMKKSQAVYQSLQSQKDQILEAFRSRFRDLNQIYYPSVLAGYQGMVKQRFSQRMDIEARTKAFIKERLQPIVAAVQSSEGTEKWESQQELWSAVIKADAVLRSRSGFSFIDPNPEQSSDFASSWSDIGPRFKEFMQ